MKKLIIAMGLVLITAIILAACVSSSGLKSQPKGETIVKQTDKTITHKKPGTIYLAGGCFWGVEVYLKKLPGVYDTDVGYANGNTKKPTYEDVCYKNTGHAETVLVKYDMSVISTDKLLKSFFNVVDPTSLNKQGNDRGSQYRSGIYYTDNSYIPQINSEIYKQEKKYGKKIATEVLPLDNFTLAEDYHQDYLDKNPTGYCHIDLSKAEEIRADLI